MLEHKHRIVATLALVGLALAVPYAHAGLVQDNFVTTRITAPGEAKAARKDRPAVETRNRGRSMPGDSQKTSTHIPAGAKVEKRGRADADTRDRDVFGQDNRIAIEEDVWPWSAMGALETRIKLEDGRWAGYRCTATLVGRCTLLTAAHCLVFTEESEIRPLTFKPRFSDDRYEVTGVTHDRRVNATTFTHYTNDDVPIDWALLKVEGAPGDDFGWVGVQNGWIKEGTDLYLAQLRTRLAGYSADVYGGNLSFDERGGNTCATSFRTQAGELSNEYLLCHKSDSFGGSSGGPLVLGETENALIVGVNSGGPNGPHPENSISCNLGVPTDYFFSSLLAKLEEECDE